MILNNLGNLAYYLKDYNQAINYYKQAIEASPALVSSYYNLSQSYREMLLFEKGDELFAKANNLSTKTTGIYSRKSARYPNYPVIEERFAKADLWQKFLSETGKIDVLSDRIWQGAMGHIPLQKAPAIAIIWAILLLVSGFLHRGLFSAKHCAFCKKAICTRCEKRLFSYQVCKHCEMRFVTVKRKSDFSMVEDAIKKISARTYLMFLFPGGGHFAIRKTKMAFCFLSIFFLLLSYIFIGDFLVPPTEWYLHQSRSAFPVILIIFLYISAFSDLAFKRSQGKWL